MEFNAVLSSMLGLKFLVLGTQLEASWATPPTNSLSNATCC